MSRSRPKSWSVQFVKMPVAFLQHPAVRTLPGSATRLLVELASRHNGRNNGSIFLSQREAHRLLGISQDAYVYGTAILESRRLIEKTSEANWADKMTTHWRLTFIANNNDIPTNEYQLWIEEDAPKVRSRKR